MNLVRTLKVFAAQAVAVASAALAISCAPDKMPFAENETHVFAGGVEVSGHELNLGYEAFMRYCYACHGEKGDGHGPSSYGLRPPPRDFTKGIFKFARLRSSDELPNDEDLVRIVKGGLHGTAMWPWDISDVELAEVLQYIKTLAPQRWEKKKRNGDPVPVLEPFEAPADPWTGNEQAAILEGKKLYHFRAECITCHAAFGTREELYKLSVEAAKEKPDVYKVMTGMRDDPYHSVPKDSAEYNQKIMPPDFTMVSVRSIRAGHELEDLFRLISYGVYPIMPAWKGAGLSDKDIWALAHYVRSLIELKGTKEALEMKQRFEHQAAFEFPKPQEETQPASTTGSDEKKGDEKKPDEKKGEEKK